MFHKVLVANRGEIAIRIIRTLREMGIVSVAVFSDPDRDAPHLLHADQAVALGGARPAESYLNIDRLLAAMDESGADAVHPGYGFLSESPELARRVTEAGHTFIGPGAEVMARFGDKLEARRLADEVGVAMVPGTDALVGDPVEVAAAASGLGYPVLIKAAGGGGGKGMRVVENETALADSVREAASEARAAFGDASVFLERYIERPRHVEIQIVADHHGNVVHLNERECSIQRRYQKIVEETPSPGLSRDLRQRMGQAAVAIARAAGYQNAGTVEFLLDEQGNFYFMEVNARLQVEHPITELVSGLDLVRCQLEIAAGRELPFTQDDVVQRGHAIECRIYAEDPARGFLPSPGRLELVRLPEGPGLRFDHALQEGGEVSLHYDPLLGKLIVHAETRDAAIARMLRALRACVVLGVRTPIEFLIEVLDCAPFRSGETHTHFLQHHFADWAPGEEADQMAAIGFVLDRRSPSAARAAATAVPDVEAASPWQTLGAWSLEV